MKPFKRLRLIREELQRIPQLPDSLKNLPVSEGTLSIVLDNIMEMADLNDRRADQWNHRNYDSPEPIEITGEHAEQILKDVGMHGQVQKQLGGQVSTWYELGAEQPDGSTRTIMSNERTFLLFQHYNRIVDNGVDPSNLFMDRWEHYSDGTREPVETIFDNRRKTNSIID